LIITITHLLVRRRPRLLVREPSRARLRRASVWISSRVLIGTTNPTLSSLLSIGTSPSEKYPAFWR